MSAIGKTALTILLVLIIVGAALWILGGKESEYYTGLSIAAPPEAIFPYLTQPERLKSWTDGLVEVSEFGPTPEADGAASAPVEKTLRVMSNADGSQTHSQDQVIRYEENLFISVQSTFPQQIVTYIYHLEPKGGQTTFLSYRIKINSSGAGRFLAAISGNEFQDRIDSDIRKLKALVESSELPLPPSGVDISEVDVSDLDSIGRESPILNVADPDGSIPDVSIPNVAVPNAATPSDGRNAETPVSGQPFSF